MAVTVPAGGHGRAEYRVTPRERGDAVMGGVVLQWRGAWGLVERWGIAPLEQTVRVYPDLQEGRREALYLIRSRQVAIEKRRAKRVGTGREFDSLRDYRPGDERRDVCWSASARRGKLVTKVYQPERSQTVWLLVDAGRLLRARIGAQTMLDRTVTAALTLAQVALASGDRVGLLAYGRRLQQRVAPGARVDASPEPGRGARGRAGQTASKRTTPLPRRRSWPRRSVARWSSGLPTLRTRPAFPT